MDILRFITAGSVDDGKSTLIGRLLYDTNNIKADVLQSVAGKSSGTSAINLAHITDGLRAERQGGITIDVAYKYFTTPKRKYIITDAPGHFQYTRNLVTGASGVDAMIILIDAQNGITDQTRRHSLVASFLRTGHVVVAINKMDIVGYDEQVYTIIKNEYQEIAAKLGLPGITFIPMSALLGDNVSFPSGKMPWYRGITLMQYLEDCDPLSVPFDATRFSVQYVIEGAGKGFAGRMLSGVLRAGDEVVILPEGDSCIVGRMINGYNEVTRAAAGDNIVVYLANNAAARRGNILAHAHGSPVVTDHFEAYICWLDAEHALQTGKQYLLRINAMETICTIAEVVYKTDVSTFGEYHDPAPVEVNQFAKVKIETRDRIVYDPFAALPEAGRGIIIDAATNYTSGAFVIQ